MNDAVAAQYERWVYPQPVADLATAEERARVPGGDFARNWHTFWPDQAPREDIDVLVAGCGANSAARYAFHHPKARVVGLDLSAASLAHERHLKNRHALGNLTLHQGRIEDVASLGQTFDFIDVSGVLHHLPDPVAGLRALGTVLRPTGTIAVMLYGAYPRAGFYMLREMFQVLGLGQSDADVAFVKDALDALPEGHVARAPLAHTRDIQYDAGLVDTFLHPQDRAYTVPECLDLVRDAGLSFVGWWDNILRYPDGQLRPDTSLYKRVAALPDEQIWQAMELYSGSIGQQTFAACLPTRESYRLDFASDAFLDYVPVARAKEVQRPAEVPPGRAAVQRGQLPMYILTPHGSALFRQIDGTKSIRACAAAALPSLGESGRTTAARDAFRFLWRLSYVFLRLPYGG